MLHRDSTIQKCLRVRRFSVPCQPSGRCVIPSGRLSVTVPSVRTTCHTVQTPDRPSIIRSDDVHFRTDHPLCREGSVQLASVRTSQQPVRTPLCTRPAPDSFQVPIKGRSNQPSGICGIPSGLASPQGKNRNSNTPVRTSDSLGPNARSSKKEITDSTSTVRTTTYHGPDTRTSVMEIAC
jgi:hypothetical protein